MYKRKQLCAWVSVSVCKLVCMCISGRVCVFMKSMLRVGILAPVWHCLTSFPATSGSSGGGHGFCGGGEGGRGDTTFVGDSSEFASLTTTTSFA